MPLLIDERMLDVCCLNQNYAKCLGLLTTLQGYAEYCIENGPLSFFKDFI